MHHDWFFVIVVDDGAFLFVEGEFEGGAGGGGEGDGGEEGAHGCGGGIRGDGVRGWGSWIGIVFV